MVVFFGMSQGPIANAFEVTTDGVYYITDGDQMQKLSIFDGSIIWTTQLPAVSSTGTYSNQTIVRNGIVYCVKHIGDKRFILLDYESGNILENIDPQLALNHRMQRWNVG